MKDAIEPTKKLLEQIAKVVDQPLLSDEEVEWALTRPLVYVPRKQP